MQALLTLLLALSFAVLATPNSIIAVVNDSVITMDSISTQINKETTTGQKLALVERQIDIALQKEKIQALGIKPKAKAINKVLKSVATQNGLTFAQLRANNQFDQIVANITQNLSFIGLKQVVLQQVNIDASQAEVAEVLANNPKKANVSKEMHLANIKAQIIRTKQIALFQDWVKNLRQDAYIEIFKDKLK